MKPESMRLNVSFDYTGHDAFAELAAAMQAFSDAFAVYAKNKKATLRILQLETGSLQCVLLGNKEAAVGLEVMSNDLESLGSGGRAPLMEDLAKTHIKRILQHVASFKFMVEGGATILIDSTAQRHLDQNSQDSYRMSTTHAGILDRVDLKANAFRLMLPHGQRVSCSPVLPFLESISISLSTSLPRLRVFGDGKYRHSDFLPNSIAVSKVEVIKETRSFIELIGDISNSLDKEAIGVALHAQTGIAEQHFENALIDD